MRDLRPEFLAQVDSLRQRVLANVKPKTIRGHEMTGSEWLTLVELYVEAINEGVVPSIQSAWTCIQRQGAERELVNE